MNGLDKIISLEKGRQTNAEMTKHHFLQQLFWECTLKCNLTCKHCGSSCKVDDTRSEMPLKDFICVLDEIKQNITHPLFVITTGGEPLLRKDLCECGKEIKKRGFYWGLVTNGMLLNSNVFDKLTESGLDSISVSLDGMREEHNWMRGNNNSFDSVLNAIDIIISSQSNFTWDVITCINKRNLHQLPEMMNLLINHHVKRWKIFTVFPVGRALDYPEMELNKEELRELLDFIAAARKKNIMKISFGCEGFLGPYEYEVRDNQHFCAAGINVASILHDGSISGCLCIRSNHKQGNIYTDSFVDVWNNKFIKYRDAAWKKTGTCTDCEVWRWCKGDGMHLRDDNGNIPQCLYRKLYH